ncbi:MAG: RNA polymerase sigma factor [Planctomycetota bacterium]
MKPIKPNLASGPFGYDPEELLTHTTWLRRFARALVHDDASADDLVQDALGAVLEARGPIRDLRGFLGGVVRRRSMDVRRRDVRRRQREEMSVSERRPIVPSVDESAARVETMRIVLEELERLPVAQREAVTRRFVDGWTAAEIARESGLSQSTVRSNLARGLAALRERLDQRCGGRSAWCAALAPWIGTGGGHAGEKPRSDGATNSRGGLSAPRAQGILPTLANPVAALLILSALGLAWFSHRPSNEVDTSAAQMELVESVDVPLSAVTEAATTRVAIEPLSTAVPEPGASLEADHRQRVATVVDVLTGEPVPSMALRLLPLDADETERLRASGAVDAAIGTPIDVDRVRTNPGLLAAYAQLSERVVDVTTDDLGRVRFEALDSLESLVVAEEDENLGGVSMQSRVALHAMGEGDTIAVRVGPTFRFDVSIPEDVLEQGVMARFCGGGSMRDFGRRAWLRDGALPWVRFPHKVTTFAGEGPWEVRLEAFDGLWIAEARVHRKIGIEPEPLRLEARRTGAIEFTVTREEGAAATSRVLRLESAAGEYVETVHFDQLGEDGVSVGRVHHLEPGSYRWSRGELSGLVDAAIGEVTKVELEEIVDGPTFDAEVLIDTSEIPGRSIGGVEFTVIDTRDVMNGSFTKIERGADGWRLFLPGLPARAWNVVPVRTKGDIDWEPGLVTVRPGESAPTLVAKLPRETATLRITATDATTGERVANAEAVVDSGAPLDLEIFQCEEPGVIVGEEVPSGRSLHLLIGAPGYRTRAISLLPERDGSTLDVSLEPGSRTPVRVLRCDDLSMAEGVEILVDGRSIGRTDAHGVAWLEGRTRPAQIELGPGHADLEIVRIPDESATFGYTIPVRAR